MNKTAAAALLALAACATAQRDISPAFQGIWGGQHIGLQVGTLDTFVAFDCADGAFAAPYVISQSGSFEWDGTFTRSTGGPVRVGQEPTPVHAVYFGVVRGPLMTLSVKLDDGQVIGPFTLERFKEPMIVRCL